MKRHISIFTLLLGAFAVGSLFAGNNEIRVVSTLPCQISYTYAGETENVPFKTPATGSAWYYFPDYRVSEDDDYSQLQLNDTWSLEAQLDKGVEFKGWFTVEGQVVQGNPPVGLATVQIGGGKALLSGKEIRDAAGTWKTTSKTTETAFPFIVAKYEKIKFNVTFESNDGVPDKIDPIKDRTIDSPDISLPTVTRNGWKFTGWKNGRGKIFTGTSCKCSDFWYEDGTSRGFDASLTAQWSGLTYSITLERNGGTGGSCPGEYTVSENPQGLEMTPPTKEGHTIQGWTVSGATGVTPTVAGSPLTLTIPKNTYGHLTLTPTWNADTFTITYKPGRGTPGNEFTAPKKWGEDTALRDKTYDDPKGQYVQDGWNTNEESFEGEPDYGLKAAYTDNASITLYPHWKLNGYKLTIHHKGAYYDGKLLEETALESLVVGTTNLNEILVAVPTNDAAFYGYYSTEDGSTQIYDEHGKCCKVKGVWSEAWAADGTFEGSADLEVWAKWGPPPEHCTIRAVCDPADGGTVDPASTNVVKGRDVMLTAKENPGYSFWHWTNETGTVVSLKDQDKFTVANNATYTAVFTGNVYTVTFVAFGGDPAAQPYNEQVGENWVLPAVNPPAGKVFDGWYANMEGTGEKITSTTKVDYPVLNPLYAKFTAKTEFDVIFVDKDGTNGAVTNKNQTIGTSVPPLAPTTWKRQYYDLVGWNPPLPQTVGSSDLEFTAVWRSVSDVLDCTNLLFNAVGNWEICMTDHVVGDSCMKLPKSDGNDLLSATITEAGTLSFNWKVDNAKFAVSTNGQDIWSSDEKSERWAPDNKETLELTAPCELRFYGSPTGFRNFCLIDNVTWTPKGEETKYTLTVTSAGNGTVDPTSTNAVKGTSVKIAAAPDAGYAFEKWSDGSTENPRQIIVISNAVYSANFTNCSEVSAALDCGNLAFTATGGWTICTDHDFAYTAEGGNDLYLKTDSADNDVSGLAATVTAPGQLTFHWRAKGEVWDTTDFFVFVNDVRKEIASQDDDDSGWEKETITLTEDEVPATIRFACDQVGAFCAIDYVIWMPDGKEPSYADTDTPVTGFSMVDGKLGFSFESDGSSTYHILGTNDVTAPWKSWPFVREIKADEKQPVQIDIKADEPKMFYRIRALK